MPTRSFGIWTIIAGAFACGGTEATPDAGSPPRPDASTSDAGTSASDAGDASTMGGACDLSKPFGAPVALRVGAEPLEAMHFRLAKGGTRAYFISPGEIGTLRAGTLAGDVVSDVATAHTAPLGIPGGFAISDDEKQLAIAASSPSLDLLARATASAPFGSARTVSFTPPTGGALPINHIYYPYFKRDGGVMFALNQRSNDNSTQIWDVYDGTLGANSITAALIAGLKPNPSYMIAPIPASTERLFLASWGHADALFFPRLFETTRGGATSPWNAPTRLTIPTLVLNEADSGPIDTLVPFDASADGCTLYFGKGVDYFGKYQVLRVQRPR
jgi:hypothetical protein